MICKKCGLDKAHSDFSTYKHPATKKVVTIKNCKSCMGQSKRGGSNPKYLLGEKRKCHNCKNYFVALSKYNILCGICRELEPDELYNVVL